MQDRQDYEDSLLGRIFREASAPGREWAPRFLAAQASVSFSSPQGSCEFPLDHFENNFEETIAVVAARMAGVDLHNIYNECPAEADRYDGWKWRRTAPIALPAV